MLIDIKITFSITMEIVTVYNFYFVKNFTSIYTSVLNIYEILNKEIHFLYSRLECILKFKTSKKPVSLLASFTLRPNLIQENFMKFFFTDSMCQKFNLRPIHVDGSKHNWSKYFFIRMNIYLNESENCF